MLVPVAVADRQNSDLVLALTLLRFDYCLYVKQKAKTTSELIFLKYNNRFLIQFYRLSVSVTTGI